MNSIIDRAWEAIRTGTFCDINDLEIAKALLEAVICLDFYASLERPNGDHACNVDVRFQIDGGDKARAFLGKVNGK